MNKMKDNYYFQNLKIILQKKKISKVLQRIERIGIEMELFYKNVEKMCTHWYNINWNWYIINTYIHSVGETKMFRRLFMIWIF